MSTDPTPPKPKPSHMARVLAKLRNWFFAGVVVAAPIGITIWLVWGFVSLVDDQIKPLLPPQWNPETYLPVVLPGLGIVMAVTGLTLLGLLTTNLIGRSLLRWSERLVNRVPVVRSIYSTLKQVFETFASGDSSSFKEAVLIEYPRKDVWSIAFVTNRSPDREIQAIVPDAIAVFVPTPPNPATGFLVYVSPDEIRRPNFSIETAIKLVVSIGIVGQDAPPPPDNVSSPG